MSEKRTALVTGSSAGIGAMIARRLAREGVRVAVNSSAGPEAGRALADELPGAVYLQADVADPAQAGQLVASCVDAHTDIAGATAQVWREILDANVLATWLVSAAAVPHLTEAAQQEGRAANIVNISSIAGVRPAGSSIPYAVSKAAVNHMTRLLAAALGPQVRVNAIAPGLVETRWTAGFDDIRARVEQGTPLRRIGQPEDVADAVWAVLCAEYVTGEVLLVDGGAHLMIG
jgi:ketoreductase RED2